MAKKRAHLLRPNVKAAGGLLPRRQAGLLPSRYQSLRVRLRAGFMEDAQELIESSETPIIPAEPLPPIQSRFLFVDVAALRAKQLRRGARIRFDSEPGTPAPHKPERVAMEEVKRGLVYYQVLPARANRAEEHV